MEGHMEKNKKRYHQIQRRITEFLHKKSEKIVQICNTIGICESIANHPLYYVISCSQHDLGNEFLLKVKTDIEQWKNEDWVRQYYKVHSLMDFVEDKKDTEGKKQSSLFDY